MPEDSMLRFKVDGMPLWPDEFGGDILLLLELRPYGGPRHEEMLGALRGAIHKIPVFVILSSGDSGSLRLGEVDDCFLERSVCKVWVNVQFGSVHTQEAYRRLCRLALHPWTIPGIHCYIPMPQLTEFNWDLIEDLESPEGWPDDPFEW